MTDLQWRFWERHFSFVLSAAFLALLALMMGSVALRGGSSGATVALKGHLTEMRVRTGPNPEESSIALSFREFKKPFIARGLALVDQQLLTTSEKVDAEFTFVADAGQVASPKVLEVPLLGLASTSSTYIASDHSAEMMAKNRAFAMGLALLCASAAGFMYWKLKAQYKKETTTPPEDIREERSTPLPPIRVDGALLWVAQNPSHAIVLCGFLFFLWSLGFFPWSSGISLVISAAACLGAFIRFRPNKTNGTWMAAVIEHDRLFRETRDKPQTVAPKHVQMIEKLLKSGLGLDLLNEAGQTPLHLAAVAGHVEAVEMLLRHGANPNIQDKEGNTPLILAAQEASLGVVLKLIAVDCRVGVENAKKETALSIAQAGKNGGIADYLKKALSKEIERDKKAAEKAASQGGGPQSQS